MLYYISNSTYTFYYFSIIFNFCICIYNLWYAWIEISAVNYLWSDISSFIKKNAKKMPKKCKKNAKKIEAKNLIALGTRASHVLTAHNTNLARTCLTSQNGRDGVRLTLVWPKTLTWRNINRYKEWAHQKLYWNIDFWF